MADDEFVYKLHYFNFKGVAEPIRYILTYLEIDFEDIQYAPDGGWDEIERQSELPLTWMNPIFECQPGVFLNDPVAIGQYLGETHNLTTDDVFYRNRIVDIAHGFCANLNGAFEFLRHTPTADGGPTVFWQQERQFRFEKFLQPRVLPRIKMLDEWMWRMQTGGYIPGFICGDKLTWADFFLYNAIRMLQTIPGGWVKGQFYVWLEQHLKKIESLPNIDDYIEDRFAKDFYTMEPEDLITMAPFRVCSEERVIRMLPLPDERWSSDEDQRLVIPKWEWPEKEKRKNDRKDERARIRKEWEEAEELAADEKGGYL